MPAPLPADLPYQTANYFVKRFGIGHARLSTLALKGLIGFKTQEAEWAPCLYNVEDVKKYVERRKIAARTTPRQMALSAGN